MGGTISRCSEPNVSVYAAIVYRNNFAAESNLRSRRWTDAKSLMVSSVVE
jgi:hypothetical protein